MTRIEDRLTEEGRQLRSDVDASIEESDVDDALSRASTSASTLASRRPRPLHLVAAAAVIALIAVVGVTVVGDDDDEQLVADEGDPAPVTQPSGPVDDSVDIEIDILADFPGPEAEVGTIIYVGVADALADRWTLTATTDPVPLVDFDQQAVIIFTLPSSARCGGALIGFDQDGDDVRPAFAAAPDATCDLSAASQMYFIAVDRADLPQIFTFVLDPPIVAQGDAGALLIDQSENSASFTPTVATEPPTGLGPDLETAEPGREITFDRIGDVDLGKTLGPAEFELYEAGTTCGYWGPGEPSHDGDEPLSGLVAIEGDQATVVSIMVTQNPRFRTASGVGVGTTLATLERIYGDELVVDRADGWESPTDGLTASYSDVAAVRNGDRALTFILVDDSVVSVKLSSADFWGDDEGCA